MKVKKYILLALLTCFYCNAYAQLTALVEQPTGSDGNAITTNISYWEYQGQRYGVYHTGEGKQEWFKLVRFTNFYTGVTIPPYGLGYTELRKIPVNSDVTVTDITVYGNYAVFCGWIKVGPGIDDTEGIIGAFDLAAMANGMSPYVYYSQIAGSYRIDKVIAYKRPAGEKLVAIGEETFPGYALPNRSYFILEANFDMFSATPPIASATRRGLFISYPALETPSELLLTDNYLAIVGYATKFNALTIRRCDPDSVLLNVGMFQDMHLYPSATRDVLSHTHSTIHVASDDHINISYLTNSNGNYFSACVRTVDLSTMQMVASQEMPLTDKSEPKDLVYVPDYKALVLVQNMPFPTTADPTTSCFVELFPFATNNYTANVIFRVSDNYGAATRNETTRRDVIAISRDDRIFVFRADYGMTFSNVTCPRKDVIGINIIDNAKHGTYTWPGVLNNVVSSIHVESQPLDQPTNLKICESY